MFVGGEGGSPSVQGDGLEWRLYGRYTGVHGAVVPRVLGKAGRMSIPATQHGGSSIPTEVPRVAHEDRGRISGAVSAIVVGQSLGAVWEMTTAMMAMMTLTVMVIPWRAAETRERRVDDFRVWGGNLEPTWRLAPFCGGSEPGSGSAQCTHEQARPVTAVTSKLPGYKVSRLGYLTREWSCRAGAS
jgi:hypothetical protein